MARIRTIKPTFFTDEKIGNLLIQARLLFIGMWCMSDDYGVVKGNSAVIKAAVFPYDEGIRLKEVQQWLDALVEARMLIPFSLRAESYYYIRTFDAHQKVDNPSKWRNCSEDELRKVLDSEHSLDSSEPSTVIHEPSRVSPPKEKEEEEDKEMEEEDTPLTPPGGIAGRFTKFWKAYPRRVGKGAAERIFLRLKVDDALLETMLNVIERAKHSKAWIKNGGEFIPHPSTWLNQKRWLDEVPQTHLVVGKHPDSLPEPPSLKDEERSLLNGITKYERLREERGLEELEEQILSNLQRDLNKLRAEKEKAS